MADGEVLDRAAFTSMTEGTQDDWAAIVRAGMAHQGEHVDRILSHLKLLDGDYGGFAVDRLEHSLQTATRAHRGRPGRGIRRLRPAARHRRHPAAGQPRRASAAAILKPFVSEPNHWMVEKHGIFQGYYFFHHLGLDRDMRDEYRGHPWFEYTAQFCHLYDQNRLRPGLRHHAAGGLRADDAPGDGVAAAVDLPQAPGGLTAMARGWRRVLVVGALLLGGAGTAQAQQAPADRAREAAAMLTAAGFQIRGAQIVNPCGRAVQPRPTAVDLNGDGKPEAVITDVDPQCYGGTGEAFSSHPAARAGELGPGRRRARAHQAAGDPHRRLARLQPGRAGLPAHLDLPGRGRLHFAEGLPRRGRRAAGRDCASACRGRKPRRQGRRLPGRRLHAHPRQVPGVQQVAGTADRGPRPERRRAARCGDHRQRHGMLRQHRHGLCAGHQGRVRRLAEAVREPGHPRLPDHPRRRRLARHRQRRPRLLLPVLRWNGSDYAIVRWKAENPGACAGRR